MSCQARMGLLVLRECGAPATGFCGSCGKSVCVAHQVGASCPDCAAFNQEGDTETDPVAQDAAVRKSYYDEYGEPEFGSGNYFNEGDNSALGRGMIAGAGLPRRRPEYDPMET